MHLSLWQQVQTGCHSLNVSHTVAKILLYQACNVMEYQSLYLFNYELFYIVGLLQYQHFHALHTSIENILYSWVQRQLAFAYIWEAISHDVYIENVCCCTNWHTTCSISYSMLDTSCHTSRVIDTSFHTSGVVARHLMSHKWSGRHLMSHKWSNRHLILHKWSGRHIMSHNWSGSQTPHVTQVEWQTPHVTQVEWQLIYSQSLWKQLQPIVF